MEISARSISSVGGFVGRAAEPSGGPARAGLGDAPISETSVRLALAVSGCPPCCIRWSAVLAGYFYELAGSESKR